MTVKKDSGKDLAEQTSSKEATKSPAKRTTRSKSASTSRSSKSSSSSSTRKTTKSTKTTRKSKASSTEATPVSSARALVLKQGIEVGKRFTDEQGNERGVYPLISLRSIVITPAANVQLIAAREHTVVSIQEALSSEEKEIAVFGQMGDNELSNDIEDISKVGVLAKILSGGYNDREQYRATIRGFARVEPVRIFNYLSEQMRYIEIKFLKEQEVDEESNKRYSDAIRSALENALDLQNNGSGTVVIDKSLPMEMIKTITEVDSLSALTDGLTQILTLPYYDKKFILETLDPVLRAKAIIAFLNNFSYKTEVDKKISEEARSAMERSQRDFYLHEQLKVIKRELNMQVDDTSEIEEYKARLAKLDAPSEIIQRIQKEISRLAGLPLNTGENSILRNYIDTMLSIPWNKSSELNKDLALARDILDTDHYGLRKVKDNILEFLAVQNRRQKPDAHGQILCLVGPPGIGKTSLANSIAKATGRKYVRVALGGMYDESEIRGHRRTYIGAMPGRIIQSMIKCEVSNPLFLLDEIDKISTNSYHGDIAAALLEVLDPEQNKGFADNYVDMDYDLSRVLFIATANSHNIPPALRDRMEIIDLSSYTADEKFHIAREYLLPKQLERNALTPEEFDITDEGIRELIQHYTLEAGVRNLERIIGELCRKVVKDLMLAESEAKAKQAAVAKERGNEELESKPTKPKRIKKRVLDVKEIAKLIGPKRFDFTSKLKENKVGVVNGLSVSSVGGDMLQVEVIANEGKGSHLLTGQLGSVMKESVSAAISWVRSHAREFSLAPDFYQSVDLHVHFPEGAIKKDGPSAGSATVTAILSALTGNAVRSDVAMTGEITLRGDVLAIGGLKEKLLAALRGGVKTVCIPHENKKDLWDMPENVLSELEIVAVKTIDEVLAIALEQDPRKFKPTTMERWSLASYEKRQQTMRLKNEAEERKYNLEIRDGSSESEVIKDVQNIGEDADDLPGEKRRRRQDTHMPLTDLIDSTTK